MCVRSLSAEQLRSVLICPLFFLHPPMGRLGFLWFVESDAAQLLEELFVCSEKLLMEL